MEIPETPLSQLGRSVLERVGQLRCPVVGDCMRPALEPGDIVVVEPLRGAVPKAGEVLLFAGAEGRLVVHRVIAARRRRGVLWLATRGDASHAWDPVVAMDDIVGRVTRAERSGQPLEVRRVMPGHRVRLRGWRYILRHAGAARGAAY